MVSGRTSTCAGPDIYSNLSCIIREAASRSSPENSSAASAEFRPRRIGRAASLTGHLSGTRRDVNGLRALPNRNSTTPAEFRPRRVKRAAPRASDAARAIADDGWAGADTARRTGVLAALTTLRLVDRKENSAAATPAELNACGEARAALRAHHHARQTRIRPAHTPADASATRRRQLPSRCVRAQHSLYDLLA